MSDKTPDKFTMQHIRDAINWLKRRDENDSEMQKQLEQLNIKPCEVLDKLKSINANQNQDSTD